MKKALLLISLVLFSLAIWANPVSLQTARKVATNFVNMQNLSVSDSAVVSIAPEQMFNQLYLFGITGHKGFVIVAADDRVLPVLGYSLTTLFPTSDIPKHVYEWLSDYDDQIEFLIAHSVEPSAEVQREWNGLLNPGSVPMRSMSSVVTPLVTTTWNQGNYYNALCPLKNSTRTVTGCVATAMAQIMKYWNHPTTGHGSHSYTWNSTTLSADFGNTTYQWSSMPKSLNSSSTTAQKNAVATLMYHVGVAVEMSYNTSANGGSSAYTYTTTGISPSAEIAYQTYFNYSNQIRSVSYSDMSDAQWKSLLKNELNNSRPVQYNGRSTSGGHSFVCDGYNASDYFHINWGWGGSYDGYFAIGALNPYGAGTGSSGSNTYNLSNAAVIGIQPISGSVPATIAVTANVNNSSYGSVTGAGTYNAYDTVTLKAVANDGYTFDHWSDNDITNPRYVFATSPTFSSTAYFKPLSSDTIAYCNNTYYNSWGYGTTSATSKWGIRYPASALAADRILDVVQLYPNVTGTYNLIIYQGDGTQMTQVYTDSYTVSSTRQWVDFPLATPYQIDSTRSLWIVLQYTGTGYPMSCSSLYGGNRNGMMQYYSGSWHSKCDNGTYNTWMIRGITSSVYANYTVTATAYPANYGTVSPASQTVQRGTQATVTASANKAYRFLQWSDGDTLFQHTATVSRDVSLVAQFQSLGSDTVSYSAHGYTSNLGSTTAGRLLWGAKFEPGALNQSKVLNAISYYCGAQVDSAITAYIYTGGDSLPDSLQCQLTFTPVANSGWNTFQLPVSVSYGNNNLWVILSCEGSQYPCSYTSYSANSNGSLVSFDGGATFSDITDYGYNATWMIRAVTGDVPIVPVTLPYTCTFEESQDASKWEFGDSGSSNAFVICNGTNNGGASALYVSNDGCSYNYTSSNSQAFARIHIPMTAGSYIVSYDYRCTGQPTVYDYGRIFLYPASNEVGCISALKTTTPTGNLTVSDDCIVSVPSWTHAEYEVTVPAAALYYFQLNWRDNASVSNQYGLAIDNISIRQETCPKPSDVSVNDVLANGAEVSWSSDVACNIQYKVTSDSVWTTINSVTSPYTLTALFPNTQYDIRVQSDCGAEQSIWSDVATFRTLCAAVTPDELDTISFETSEGFVSGTGKMANCWTVGNLKTTTAAYIPFVASTGAKSGSNALRMRAYKSSTMNYDSAYAVMPEIVFTSHIRNYELHFSMRKISTSTSTSYNDTLWVGILDDHSDLGSLQIVGQAVNSTTTYQDYVIDLGNCTDDGYIVFLAAVDLNSAKTVKNAQFYVDDITLAQVRVDATVCQAPANLTATLIGCRSFRFDWQNPTLGTANEQPNNFTYLFSQTAVNPDSLRATKSQRTKTTTVATGTLYNNVYHFYVKNVYNGESSEWAEIAVSSIAQRPAVDSLRVVQRETKAVTLGWSRHQYGTERKWKVDVIRTSDSSFVKTVVATTNSIRITGLEAETEYRFTVSPRITSLTIGEPKSIDATTLDKPAAPINLRAEITGHRQVTFSWDNGSAMDANNFSYKLASKYININKDKYNDNPDVSGYADTTATFTKLSYNTTYYFYVRNVRADGAASDWVICYVRTSAKNSAKSIEEVNVEEESEETIVEELDVETISKL